MSLKEERCFLNKSWFNRSKTIAFLDLFLEILTWSQNPLQDQQCRYLFYHSVFQKEPGKKQYLPKKRDECSTLRK